MKKIIFTLFALSLLHQTGFAVDFYTGNYQQALAKGKKENKALFLYFTAKWCGPCQYMQKYIFPDTTLSIYIKQNYIALKLDIDTEEGKLVYYKLQQPKGSTGVPAFIIMNGNEEILKKDVGGMKLAQLQQFLFKNERQNVIYQALSDSIAAQQMKSEIKEPTFISKLFYNANASKWKPGLKIGANLTSLKLSSNSKSLRMGYELGLFYDRSFKFKGDEKRRFWSASRYHFQPGLSLSSQRGRLNINGLESNMSLHYLVLELFNGYQIKRLRGVELTISPYAALGLGKNTNKKFNQSDYGLKMGLTIQYGTLQANLGYNLGLKDRSALTSSSAHNRGFYLSFAMIVGK